jgi:hypothetical protein
LLTFSIPLLVACLTDEPEEPTVPGADLASFVNTVEAPIGDLACFTGKLATEVPVAACQASAELDADVEDFETGEEIPGAQVEFFWGDEAVGTPDQTLVADGDGHVAGETRTCTPLAFRVTTADGQTLESFEYHRVHGVGTLVEMDFLSVSAATVTIIKKLLDIEPVEGTGVVVGTAFDCNDDELENAQVVLHDADGWIPPDLVVKYFQDGFPDRALTDTTHDGLWLIANVPPGDWIVDTYVADGAGGHSLVGSAVAPTFSDGLYVASTFVGREGGVKYPETCLSPCL